ncbi:MAG: hypothetical protein QE263_04710 [Vampirovibrionales bacterium]|nr:hypothetical protein [Vampirovibrionales bacterium]
MSFICHALPRCQWPCVIGATPCHPKYRRPRRLHDATKALIVCEVYSGLAPTAVAADYAVSDAAVYRLLRLFERTGTVNSPKRLWWRRKQFQWQLPIPNFKLSWFSEGGIV